MNRRVTLLGHPVHPALAAFPVGAYLAAALAYTSYAAAGQAWLFRAGVVANVLGVVVAVAVVIPGALDWVLGTASVAPPKGAGVGHSLLYVGALVLFGTNAAIQARQWSVPSPSYVVALALAGSGAVLMLAAAYLAWRMVRLHEAEVLAGAKVRSRVPFWIAPAPPFERPPRR